MGEGKSKRESGMSKSAQVGGGRDKMALSDLVPILLKKNGVKAQRGKGIAICVFQSTGGNHSGGRL